MRIVKSAEERKNEILDVAAALFAEKGYDNASTNDIIEKIGIARGTLYHHFGSKEEILDALVDRMTREGVKRAGTIVRDKNCPIIPMAIRIKKHFLPFRTSRETGSAPRRNAERSR
jgi:AcrR family transcriptional regulator